MKQQPRQRIVCTRPDGGLSIVIPAIMEGDPEGFTAEQATARAMKDVPEGATDVHVVDHDDIPDDRTYRAAWSKRDGEAFAVDLDKVPAQERALKGDATILATVASGSKEQRRG